jgi:riboflavin kinase/FMN adenylyltransferase
MEYICGKTEFRYHNSCVTLGKFDGLHRGHQLLLSYLYQYEKQGYTSVMFTFDYHPGNLFSEREIDLIYTEEEKKALLTEQGPQVLISYPFTKESASIEPEEFITQVLIQQLDAKIIVVGKDYHFGRKRRGDVAMLREFSKKHGYELIVCEKLKYDGQVISSTRIRKELSLGHIELVNDMLGHPYTIVGTVVHGRQLGRTIGIPTVNILPLPHKLLPPFGVYASKVRVNGSTYYGITNIGCKPTVEHNGQVGVETYIFDFNEDIYGHEISVELYTFERGEAKFASVEELKLVMEKDIEFAKEYFKL